MEECFLLSFCVKQHTSARRKVQGIISFIYFPLQASEKQVSETFGLISATPV
jgi:hypothetical protein